MFNDEYTDFIFNNIHSSSMKVWITNNRDLVMKLSPSFSDTFQDISLGNNRVYGGTSITKQDIKVSCAALQVTMGDWRAITNWLSPSSVGNLRFMWNKKHYFNAKLSSISDGEYYDTGIADKVLGTVYNITFDVTFTTVNDWASLGDTIVSEGRINNVQCFNNDYVIPACWKKKDDTYYLMNYGNFNMYPDLLLKNVKRIKDDTTCYFEYSSTNDDRKDTNISIRNKEGVMYANGVSIYKVVNRDGVRLYQQVNYEPLVLESGRPELLKCRVDWTGYKGGTLVLYPNKPLVYERYKPFVAHLFDTTVFSEVNKYGIDKYNTKAYGSVDFTTEAHSFLADSPYIEYDREKNAITMNVTEMYESMDAAGIANKVSVLYLSLCDYKAIMIEQDGEASFTVVSQSRDAN